MKVLAITNLFPNAQEPTRGVFNKQQFVELAKLCELKVVAPLPWHYNQRIPRREMIEGIETMHPRYIMTPKVGRSLYGLFFYLSLRGYLKRLYNTFRFDIILATWAYPDAFGSWLFAKELRKPIVVKVHGSDINDYTQYFLRRRMISAALSKSNKVIAVSGVLKEKLENIGVSSANITVIGNGVDTSLFKPMEQEFCRKRLGLLLDRHVILYCGNIVAIKGVDVLIEAFAQLSASDPKAVLVLLGNGDMENVLWMGLRKLGIKEKVFFVDRCAHDRVAWYMNAADVVCLPSRNEGCPNVILEAMGCGRYVVATDVGGVADILEGYKKFKLVSSGNINELATGLKQSLCDNVGVGTAQLNSWKDTAYMLHDVLKSVISPD